MSNTTKISKVTIRRINTDRPGLWDSIVFEALDNKGNKLNHTPEFQGDSRSWEYRGTNYDKLEPTDFFARNAHGYSELDTSTAEVVIELGEYYLSDKGYVFQAA